MRIYAPNDMSQDHIDYYVEETIKRNPEKNITQMNLSYDGEDVLISYEQEAVPFERIRRITGYLVGTLDRFNDAKKNEEKDRVKHSL